MAFTIQKISNYGTTHPVVARLMVQTPEVLQWASLAKDQSDAVTALYFSLARDRLLKCHEVYERLRTAGETAIAELPIASGAQIQNVPHLIGLRGEAETFLYEAKNFLRDLLGVVNIFFGTDFREASDFSDPKGMGNGNLVKWAEQQFGATDPFTTMLVTEQPWAMELIRKRNAVEHPGGKSGTLHFENFTVASGVLVPPTWRRDQLPATPILMDLTTYLGDLLTLAEDMLVSCVHHTKKFGAIQFVEVPEAERNAGCPVRVRVILDPSKLGSPVPVEPEAPTA